MPTTITLNGEVTLDESIDLQTGGVADGGEDNNDSDILLSALQSGAATFYNRLFTDLALSTAFATANGVAKSADNFISVGGGGTVNSLGFVNGSGGALSVYAGDPTAGVATSLLAVDGGAITLFMDASLGNRMVLGYDSDGDIVFALFLDPNAALTTAQVWMVQFEAISNPDASNPDDAVDLFDSLGVGATASTEFNFGGLPSGQNLFGIVGDASSALVVIGKLPVLKADGTFTNTSNTINTSQGGGPTTIGIDNQMFDPGEGAYFTFVTNPDPNFLGTNLGATEADDADNILFGERIETNSAFLRVSQLQGAKTAELKITCFNGDNTTDGRAFVTGNLGGAPVTILTVRVTHLDGTFTDYSPNAATATVTVIAGDKVEWTTSGLHDQVLVEGVSGKFDIGGFGINQSNVASVDIGDRVNFEDDGPSATASATQPELTVDESDLATDADDSFESVFTAAFGTDGEAATDPVTYALGVIAGESGLVDTATGEAVILSLNGDVVEGRTETSDDLVFTVSVDADGNVTLDQLRAVVHGDDSDPDDSTTLSADNLVTLTATASDGDGDEASATADIGLNLIFKDDGPSVDLSLQEGAEIRVDESLGENAGEDETSSLGKVTVAGAVLFDSNDDFGEDGEGTDSPGYALALSAEGADSGLDDVASGESVLLYTDGNDIVGLISGDVEVLRISIDADSGDVTVDLLRALVHPNAEDPDEADVPLSIAAGLVSAERTITDGDGDSDSDSADVGPAIKFEDDGPSADADGDQPDLTVDETDLTDDTTDSFAGVFGGAFGSDGEGASGASYALGVIAGASGLTDTASGQAVILSLTAGGVVEGRTETDGDLVFTVSVDADGNVTLDQLRAVVHGDDSDPDDSTTLDADNLVTLTATGTDGDGDEAEATADIGFNLIFKDDGPDVDLSLKAGAEILIDESIGANDGENEDTSLGKLTVPGAVLFDTTADFGEDGAGTDDSSYALTLSADGADSGLDDTASGESVLLYKEGDDIVGRTSVGGDEVLRISIDEDDGDVTVDLLRALVNPDTGDNDESADPLSIAAGLVFAERTITDGDGDSDSDDADIGPAIKFEDDGPTQAAGQSDAKFITDDTDIEDTATISTDLIFPSGPSYGSDGPAADPISFALRLAEENGDSGLVDTETGQAILFVTEAGTGDIVGYVDEDGSGVIEGTETLEAFRYHMEADDSDTETITFSQIRAIVHDDPTDPDESDTPKSIASNLVFVDRTATDGDGDTAEVVSFDLGTSAFLEDSGPSIGDEDGNIEDGIVDFEPGSSVTNSLNGNIGEDPNATPYILTAFTESVTIGDDEITGVLADDALSVTYYQDTDGDGEFGSAGDTAFFKLTLGDQAGAGTYTFEVFVDAPPVFTEFDFGGLPSGQNLFGMVGDPDFALVVIGKVPVLKADGTLTNTSNTINTSQGGGPTTIGINNQMFDPGEGAYFTFVDSPDPSFLATALSATEADDADNIQFGSRLEVSAAFLTVVQLQGAKTCSLKLSCFDGSNDTQDGRAFATTGGTGGLGTGTQIKITEYTITHADGTSDFFDIADAFGVTITGVKAGDTISWKTDGDHDQVLVEGVSGKFDIGGFGALEANDLPDQLLEFTAQATDGDGDTDTASWSVGIDGTGIYDDGIIDTSLSSLAFGDESLSFSANLLPGGSLEYLTLDVQIV